MPPHLAIIADDLTGAMDTGLQFVKAGQNTVVSLTGCSVGAALPGEIIVVTTDSREADASVSYEAVRSSVHALAMAGVQHFYKKVDSTLRGHIATDLDAMLDTLGWRGVLFCPAFPENGRVMVGGYYLVGQVPLQLTELADDPGAHFRTSYVPDFLQANTRRRVGLIPLSTVLAGAPQLLGAIGEAFYAGQEILVVDAATREDLAAIAEAAERWSEPLLLAGSAGLAQAIAARMPTAPRSTHVVARPSGEPVDHPVLLISGSTTAVNRKQVDFLASRSSVVMVTVKASRLIAGDAGESVRVVAEALEALRTGRDVLLLSAPDAQSVTEGLAAGNARGLSGPQTRERLAAALAKVTAEIASQCPLAGLVLTGGEIARLVLSALDTTLVEVLGEVQPGVPCGRILRAAAPPLPIVTKSGSLGGTEALLQALEFLKRIALEVEAFG